MVVPSIVLMSWRFRCSRRPLRTLATVKSALRAKQLGRPRWSFGQNGSCSLRATAFDCFERVVAMASCVKFRAILKPAPCDCIRANGDKIRVMGDIFAIACHSQALWTRAALGSSGEQGRQIQHAGPSRAQCSCQQGHRCAMRPGALDTGYGGRFQQTTGLEACCCPPSPEFLSSLQ